MFPLLVSRLRHSLTVIVYYSIGAGVVRAWAARRPHGKRTIKKTPGSDINDTPVIFIHLIFYCYQKVYYLLVNLGSTSLYSDIYMVNIRI